MTKKGDPETLAALQEALGSGSGWRAPLARWMLENHDEFAALLGRERPNWARLTAKFTELGFRNADGTELNKATVRHLWWRVKKEWASRQGNGKG